jgi:nucleoside 2-deoxyribosyltransferase
MKPRLYLAGPLFSEPERSFNATLARELERTFSVYLPQRDGCLIVDLVEEFHIPWSEAAAEVFERDIAAICNADLVIAILDGRSIDEGTAFELGYAFALRKECWGLKTDPRTLLKYGDNPMILGALKQTFATCHALLDTASKWVDALACATSEADK